MRKTAVGVFAALIVTLLLLPPFRFPVAGTVSSGFFLRRRPESSFALNLEIHKGIDIAARQGDKVIVSAPGRVTDTGFSESYGNYVTVRHFLGFETRYAHLSEVFTQEGAFIFLRSLRPIGTVGSTGRSTGPHLHFETLLLGRNLPPRFLLVFHGFRKAVLRF